MPKPALFLFSVPSLPKDYYQQVQKACAFYGISQWHVVLVGLEAMKDLGAAGEHHVAKLVEKVKGLSPGPK